MAHEVQRAVDHVQQQLVAGCPAKFGGQRGHFGADNHLAFQMMHLRPALEQELKTSVG